VDLDRDLKNLEVTENLVKNNILNMEAAIEGIKLDICQLDELKNKKEVELAKMEDEIETAKTELCKIKILGKRKADEIGDEEERTLKLNLDPNLLDHDAEMPNYGINSGVSLKDIRMQEMLFHESDVDSWTVKAMMKLLRKLHIGDLHTKEEVKALWNGKGPEWKAIYGQTPKIICGYADKKILRLRITTYLKLQRRDD